MWAAAVSSPSTPINRMIENSEIARQLCPEGSGGRYCPTQVRHMRGAEGPTHASHFYCAIQAPPDPLRAQFWRVFLYSEIAASYLGLDYYSQSIFRWCLIGFDILNDLSKLPGMSRKPYVFKTFMFSLYDHPPVAPNRPETAQNPLYDHPPCPHCMTSL